MNRICGDSGICAVLYILRILDLIAFFVNKLAQHHVVGIQECYAPQLTETVIVQCKVVFLAVFVDISYDCGILIGSD